MINWQSEERLKKVLCWRFCSIMITLLTTWVFTGSIKQATHFTVMLHIFLIISHYIFETWWDRRLNDYSNG